MSQPPDSNSTDLATRPPEEPSNSAISVPRKVLILVGFIVVAFAVGVGALVSGLAAKTANSSPTAQTVRPVVTPRPPATPTPDGIIKIQISGEVKSPGVYEMHTGDRVEDALALAGGLTEQGDSSKLDLAQRVKDEMKIDVPRLPPATATAAASNTTANSVNSPTTTATTAKSATTVAGDGKVNVNTASAAELDKLPGIGTTLAQRIVDYRTKNGPFGTVDDLKKVSGITKSVIEKIKDLISF